MSEKEIEIALQRDIPIINVSKRKTNVDMRILGVIEGLTSKHFHDLPNNNNPSYFNKLVKNIYDMIRSNYKTIQKITELIEFEQVEVKLDKIIQTTVENKESKKILPTVII